MSETHFSFEMLEIVVTPLLFRATQSVIGNVNVSGPSFDRDRGSAIRIIAVQRRQTVRAA